MNATSSDYRSSIFGKLMMASAWVCIPLSLGAVYAAAVLGLYSVGMRAIVGCVGFIALCGSYIMLSRQCIFLQLRTDALCVKLWSGRSKTYSPDLIRSITCDNDENPQSISIRLQSGKSIWVTDGVLRVRLRELHSLLQDWFLSHSSDSDRGNL
jgi:hypothetical protein